MILVSETASLQEVGSTGKLNDSSFRY